MEACAVGESVSVAAQADTSAAMSRADGTRKIATMLPKGWEFAGVFGPQAEARALRLDRLPDNVMHAINARATQDKPRTDADGLPLPQTASAWEVSLALGLLLTAFGAALLGRRRSAIRLRGRAVALTARADRMRATSRNDRQA